MQTIEIEESQYLAALTGVAESTSYFDFVSEFNDVHPEPQFVIWGINNGSEYEVTVYLNRQWLGYRSFNLTLTDFQKDLTAVLDAVYRVVENKGAVFGYHLMNTAL